TTLTTVRGYTPEQALALNLQYKLENRRQVRLVLPRNRPVGNFETLEEIAHGLLGAIKGPYTPSRHIRAQCPPWGAWIRPRLLIDLDMAALDARSWEGSSAYRTGPVVDGSPPFKRSRQYLEKENEPPSNDIDAESGEAISEDQGDLETEAHKAQRTVTLVCLLGLLTKAQAPSF
ncbi:hypothetical protein BZG36_01972, partial [Bifiguratus adelaidae]